MNGLECVTVCNCTNCKYATLYIPYYTYPWSTPYCAMGHGLWDIKKNCDDWELLGRNCR